MKKQGPGIRGQGLGVRDQGPGIRGQGSGVRDQVKLLIVIFVLFVAKK